MPGPRRYPKATHVFIIDGTLSRLAPGEETNAGLLYKLLAGMAPRRDLTVGYDAGVQGEGFLKWVRIAAGYGINASIMAGYARLASRYRPGDRIMLFGYSRGAYAVRSIAGMIGRIGLLRRNHATERHVQQAFRYYEAAGLSDAGQAFRDAYCHKHVPIEVLGVWDTVKALGLPYPIVSRLVPMVTDFHDPGLGPAVRNAFQALAVDETRAAYEALLWRVAPDWPGRVAQVWFPGCHSDVGGHVYDVPAARALSNIPLVWMLEQAEAAGLDLPADWRRHYPTDPCARAKGNTTGHARLFLNRAPRVVGRCSSESVHPSVAARIQGLPGYAPQAVHHDPDTEDPIRQIRALIRGVDWPPG